MKTTKKFNPQFGIDISTAETEADLLNIIATSKFENNVPMSKDEKDRFLSNIVKGSLDKMFGDKNCLIKDGDKYIRASVTKEVEKPKKPSKFKSILNKIF